MKTLSRLFTLALLSGSVALAVAQVPFSMQQGPAPYAAFDYNRDGVISEQEFNRLHSERMSMRMNQGMPMRNRPAAPVFADIDSDKDGVLSQDELFRYQQMRQQGRRGMGPMGPGQRGRNMPVFAEFDLNQDSVLGKEEFIEARGQRIARLAGEGRMLRGLANMPGFEAIDGNRDGLISPEEFYTHQTVHCRRGWAN